MNVRLTNLWDSWRSGYWFVPALMIVVAIALEQALAALDSWLPNTVLDGLWFMYHSTSANATSLLLTIAGAMIAILGVVYTVTMVPLTIAAAQLGPRLLRTFLRDTTTQIILGYYSAAFVYCLLVLLAEATHDGNSEVPQVSLTVGILLALLAPVLLIYFIHHISVSIQASAVIAAVGGDLSAAIERSFPPVNSDDHHRLQEIEDRYRAIERDGRPIAATATGYIHAIDYEALLEIAVEHDLTIALHQGPGDFQVPGSAIASAVPAERIDADIAERIAQSSILGEYRTLTFDVEFGINSLVEVALRALSLAINDPFTAMTCIDRLGAALSLIGERGVPSRHRDDDGGTLRLIVEPQTFERLVDSAFHQIRQYGRGSAEVLIRMLQAISVVSARAALISERAVLLRHAELIATDNRQTILAEYDRQRIEQVHQRTIQAIGLGIGEVRA